VNSTASLRNAIIPQSGSFIYTNSNTTVPFTGNAVVRSYQTHVTHQIALLPYIGRAFDSGFAYIGGGPVLSQTGSNLDGLIGFADIGGKPTDVSGPPTNFAGSSWALGGAGVIGATYFFNPSWFADIAYKFAMTSRQTYYYSSSFVNPNGPGGSITNGTLVGNSSGTVMTQGVTFTINRMF
jgi:hypothetical protein